MATKKATQFKTDIAFKKLATGKTATRPDFNEFQEAISSPLQASTDQIFGETIPLTGLPNTYGDSDTNLIVQFVSFSLEAIPGTSYDADTILNEIDTGDNNDTNTHAFRIKLLDDYVDTTNAAANTHNNVNTGPYINNGLITGSSIQLVPPGLGGAAYNLTLFDSNGNSLGLASDPQDFYIDYAAGVVIRQDVPNGGDNPPVHGTGFLYVGKYANAVTPENTGSNLQQVLSVGNSASLAVFLSGSTGNNPLVVSGGIADFGGTTNVTASVVSASSIFAGTYTGDDAAFANNVSIGGNLSVLGTTTTINSTDLTITDKFIHIASGSQSPTDAGLVVSYDDHPFSGSAFYYDSALRVWAIDDRGANGTTADAANHDAVVVTVAQASGTPIDTIPKIGRTSGTDSEEEADVTTPTAGATGQMYVDTNDTDGDGNTIYIYA